MIHANYYLHLNHEPDQSVQPIIVATSSDYVTHLEATQPIYNQAVCRPAIVDFITTQCQATIIDVNYF